MIIRDKQDLRKCVKQCVRRASVVETAFDYDLQNGAYGIESALSSFADTSVSLQNAFFEASGGSPLAQQPAALLAALDAMQLPAHNLDKAAEMIAGYDRISYLDHVLNAMRAKRVLVRTHIGQDEQAFAVDHRFSPLLSASCELFYSGRYGVDYAKAAQILSDAAHNIHARDILLEEFNAEALSYCLVPLSEDEAFVLHLHLKSEQEIDQALQILSAYSEARALISAEGHCELHLIEKAKAMKNVLVTLSSLSHLPDALMILGIRFVPYASRASCPEELLGKWVCFKETLWESLYAAYLRLARTGYELTREQIEKDVDMLFFGHLEQLYL